jgi:hypothetical protein
MHWIDQIKRVQDLEHGLYGFDECLGELHVAPPVLALVEVFALQVFNVFEQLVPHCCMTRKAVAPRLAVILSGRETDLRPPSPLQTLESPL